MARGKCLCLARPCRASSTEQTRIVIYLPAWSLNWVCLHDCCQLLLENKQTWCKYHDRKQERKRGRDRKSQNREPCYPSFVFSFCSAFPLIHIHVFPNALSPKSPRCGRALLLLVSNVSSHTKIYTRRREAQYKVPRPNPPIRGPNPYPSLPAQGRLWATISLLHPS